MFLVQVGRSAVARAAARDGAPAAADPDPHPSGRAQPVARGSRPAGPVGLTDTLGAAGDRWTVDVGRLPPPPRVIVEIAAATAGYAAAMLVDTLRTRLTQSLPVAPADIDVRLTPTPG